MATEIHQCAECVELLADYLEGALPRDRSEALERHLSLCMPCITFVRTYKKTTVIARETLAQEMPPELSDSLEQFLRAQIPGFVCDSRKCSGGDKTKK